MSTYLLVALGGAIGSVVRFALAIAVGKHFGESFPWGTLIINVTGSFAIGFFSTLTEGEGRWPISLEGRQFFMVGICGGYTTFSAFSLQTLALAREGDWPRAGGYVAASVVFCLLAVWIGHALAASLNAGKGG